MSIDRRRGRFHLGPYSVVAALAVALSAGCARIDPEEQLAIAAQNMAAQQYDEAAIRLYNAVEAAPDNAEARRLRGELSLATGDNLAAVEELGRAQALGTPLEAIAISMAEAAVALGETDRALTTLDAVAARLSSEPRYWTVRAEVLLRAGRTNEAEAALDEGEQAGGDGARALVARASVAAVRNDLHTAEELLGRALSAAPNDPKVLTARSDVLARTGRLPQAAEDLLRAADHYRDLSIETLEIRTLLALMQVHIAANDLDAAETTAARMAERAPQAALTSYFRGLVAYRRERFDEAAALVQPLVSISPDTVQFRALLGAIQLARGNLGQAEQQFRTILVAAPQDPAAIKLLAETQLRQQRPEAALATLRTVGNEAPEDAQIALLSGLASLQSGDAEQGLLYLEQATSLDPANQLLKLQLARAYLASGRNADASGVLKDTFGGEAQLDAALLQLFAELRLGDAAAGEAQVQQLLAAFPREPRALAAAATYFQVQGNGARARALFEQAAELETTGTTARLMLAASLVQEGRGGDAEQVLTRVIDDEPNDAQALISLAEIVATRGDDARAAELLRRAADTAGSPTARLALVQLLIRQGDLASARQELSVAARTSPDNAEVTAIDGVLTLTEGRAAEAVSLLQRAATALPNRLGIALALSRAELASGRPDAARATLRRLLELAPQSLPVRLALGDTELRLGNTAEVLTIANALKVEFPTSSGGYVLEGEAQIATRRYVAAADTFSAAFDRDPSWPVLARWVGAMQLAERPADALDALESWVAANPQHVPSALLLANLHQTGGRAAEALRTYEGVLRVDDTNLVALNNAAWLAHELGEGGALQLAERAQQAAPDNPAVLDTLGWILLRENREQDAIVHLARAAELAPAAPEIRYHHAAALAANGQAAEARSILTALLAESRDFAGRPEAQQLLGSL